MKVNNKLIGAGLLTAITASLCCITPLLALLAGTSGLASTFSWIEPFRPYLIGLTVLVLGIAWYQKIKSTNEMDCCTTEKPKFIDSKTFLGLITAFTIIMLSFPSFSTAFYPNIEKQLIVVDTNNITTLAFEINGMTCTSCEVHVNHKVNQLDGIIDTKVSYENGNAIIAFDNTKTKQVEIEKAINSTGYKVTQIK